MKKLSLLAAIAIACFCGQTTSVRAADTNAFPVTIQISGISAKSIVSVTNSGTVTTTIATSPVKIANADILKMLQTEFVTSFPTGAQLAFDIARSGFVVLDKNQNLIMDVRTNPADSAYGFSLSNSVIGANSPVVESGKAVEKTATTNGTIALTMTYADYGIFYTDSHGNNFHFIGFATIKTSEVITAGGTTPSGGLSLLLSGTGGGKVFNSAEGHSDEAVFMSAKFSGSAKNIIVP